MADNLEKVEAVTDAERGGDTDSATADNKFMGRKERRRSSAIKMFLGDYLGLATNSSVLRLLAKHGDRKVAFADFVIKVNRRNKMQKRILLVTDAAVYNLDPTSFKCKRRIPLNLMGSLSLSELSDNFFATHVPTEYDYLLVSSKKTEIVTQLMQCYQSLQQKPLPVHFGDSFDYRVDNDTLREIRFTKVDGGVSTQIFTKPDVKK